MEKEVIQIEKIPVSTLFNEFDKLGNKLKSIETTIAKNLTSETKPFYTRAEVAKLFKVSYPTLTAWKKKGVLTPCRIGSRVVYRLEDINESVIKMDIKD